MSGPSRAVAGGEAQPASPRGTPGATEGPPPTATLPAPAVRAEADWRVAAKFGRGGPDQRTGWVAFGWNNWQAEVANLAEVGGPRPSEWSLIDLPAVVARTAGAYNSVPRLAHGFCQAADALLLLRVVLPPRSVAWQALTDAADRLRAEADQVATDQLALADNQADREAADRWRNRTGGGQ